MIPARISDSIKVNGLPSVADAELFSIDLMGTTLSFLDPARGIKNKDWLRGFPIDERPFVNTVSKSGYTYHSPSKPGSCDVYQNGWTLHAGRWWRRQALATIRLHLSLETPAVDEYERFPNLLNEDCLREWLQLYYRERQAIFNQLSFDKTPEGDIVMIINDDEPDDVEATPVPIHSFSEHRCDLPGFFVYLNPGIVELNVPVGRRDVANFRFKLKFLAECSPTDAAIKEQALAFISNILASVDVTLSAEEAQHREATALHLTTSV